MVSARVLNHGVLGELYKMSVSSPAVSRNLPCGSKLNSIKRDLFGTANTIRDEDGGGNRHLSAVLERRQEIATSKWGFDFRADRPLSSSSTFAWERVSQQESIVAPEMYTLTRAAHVRPASAADSEMDLLLNVRAERENMINSSLESTTDNESCYDSQDEALTMVPSSSSNAGASTSTAASCCSPRKRQLKITEFMKERKRLAQAPKKISPAKRQRSSPSSSSIGAHFSALLKRPRHN